MPNMPCNADHYVARVPASSIFGKLRSRRRQRSDGAGSDQNPSVFACARSSTDPPATEAVGTHSGFNSPHLFQGADYRHCHRKSCRAALVRSPSGANAIISARSVHSQTCKPAPAARILTRILALTRCLAERYRTPFPCALLGGTRCALQIASSRYRGHAELAGEELTRRRQTKRPRETFGFAKKPVTHYADLPQPYSLGKTAPGASRQPVRAMS